MTLLKRCLKAWLPPALADVYKKQARLGVHFRGEFPDWQTAAAHAEGYDSAQILERVRWATRKVVSGQAAGERDSVLFDQTPYPFPVIALLLRAAMENGGRLSVLDFGGALGSSYHQCKDFLKVVSALHWSIVEQAHYVRAGKLEFETETLRFHETVDAASQASPPQAVLVSGVLQYMPDPANVLKSLVSTEAEYIVIDRTPFALDGRQRISTQSVPSSINASSYPLRLFNEEQLKAPLLTRYDEIASFAAVDGALGYGGLKAIFKGFIFKKRKRIKEGS
jgi:putative methyltransferase (TIGR04325 family)